MISHHFLFMKTQVLRNNQEIMNLYELQMQFLSISDSNYSSVVSKIEDLGYLSAENLPTLSRTIYHFAALQSKKYDLFTRLIIDLQRKTDIYSAIKSHLYYGFECYALHFIDNLVTKQIITEEEEKKVKTIFTTNDHLIKRQQSYFPYRRIQKKDETAEILAQAIENDDIDVITEITSSPNFDINMKVPEIHTGSLKASVFEATLIQYAALCGSMKSFKYFFLNKADTNPSQNNFYQDVLIFVTMGGNVDIFELLMQEGFLPNRELIPIAIEFHHIEIFDWLIEKLGIELEFRDMILCARSEFIHGFLSIDNLETIPVLFIIACERNFVEFVKITIEHDSVDCVKGLIKASEHGNLEIVKLIINLKPGIDINETRREVFLSYFIMEKKRLLTLLVCFNILKLLISYYLSQILMLIAKEHFHILFCSHYVFLIERLMKYSHYIRQSYLET